MTCGDHFHVRYWSQKNVVGDVGICYKNSGMKYTRNRGMMQMCVILLTLYRESIDPPADANIQINYT